MLLSKRAGVKSDSPAYEKKEKSESGGTIYRYDEGHIKKRWDLKKEKLKKLEKEIEKVRTRYTKDLDSDDEKTRAIASIVGLMDDTAMRIGNEDSAKEGTFGATTLKVKHVKGGSGNMTFDFPGKGAIEQNVVLKNKKVIKVIRDLMKGKKANDFIFEVDGTKIWDRAVNRYLKEFGISAKDLRGFHANRLMKEQLKKKDFKGALEEVAEIVGHEPATLKNQYLDPDLVEKHEGKEKKDKDKKKKAGLSIRAYSELPQAGSPPEEPTNQAVTDPTDWQQLIKLVDIDRNVNNKGDAAIFNDPSTALAWRVIAPFLPAGATITSAYRDDHEQARILLEYWRSWGKLKDNNWNNTYAPMYSGYFHTKFSKEKGISSGLIKRLYDKSLGNLPFTREEQDALKNISKIIRYAPVPKGFDRPDVDAPGESAHQEDIAFDVTGANLRDIEKIIPEVSSLFPGSIQLLRAPYREGKANNAVHVVLSRSVSMPDTSDYVTKLYPYQNPSAPKIVTQSYRPALSKRAKLSPEDAAWVNSIKSQLPAATVGTQQVGTDSLKKDLRIRSGVKLNQLILDAWKTLRVFLPSSAVMTSGFRTPEDQKRILDNYWKKATGKRIPDHLKSDERVWAQVSMLLYKHHGYVVGPPVTKRNYGHLKGNAFDVSGAGLEEIAAAVRMVSSDVRLPVKFRRPLVEDKNNAVHIGVESATYDENAIAQVANSRRNRVASISKLAKEEGVKEFEEIYDPDSFDYEACAEDCFADDEEDFKVNMGFGKEDAPGDWFEKSPRFRHREEVPDFDIHDVTESEAEKLVKEDPEKFFYQGLHKKNPELEAEALKNLIETNAKFFFIFRYNEREEEEFQKLVERAAELLSLQDVRAFFYYNLHHMFPELGRGAIIQLIDTNPDTFFDFGLQKDYPDLEESAGSARNIRDPNKVELEQPEWIVDNDNAISIRDKNAAKAISKRAAESKIELTEDEKKVLDVFSNTVEEFKLRTTVRVVGGWVRDKVMGHESKDIDVAVDNMTGKEFAKYIKQYARQQGIKVGIGLVPAKPEQGKNLETAFIRMFGQEIEVVNLRDEEYDEKSRRPVTTITNSPVKDAFRRDLTINSLFYNVNTGEVEDFTGDGINDIKEGVIRTPTTSPENEDEVGREITPKAIFMDDPLRVLRAIRFANRYGFKIQDDLTEAAQDPEVQDAFRKKITWERRQDELRKIMSENKSPKYALNLIKDWGYRSELLQLPDEYFDWELDQNNPNHELNVWNHLMEALDNVYTITKDADISKADRYVLNWAALLHDIGKLDPRIVGTKQVGDQIRNTFYGHEKESVSAAEHLLKQLKGTRSKEIKRIQSLINAASQMNPRHIDTKEQAVMSNKSVIKILQITKDFEQDWQRAMEIAIADSSAHKEGWLPEYPMTYWESLRGKFTSMPPGTATMGPLLDGNELMQLFGRKGGMWLGTINKAMVEWQMENQGATKDQAVEFAKKYYAEQGLEKMSALSVREKHVDDGFTSLSLPKISKRAEDELSVVKDPLAEIDYLSKVLKYIEENLKTERDPNKQNWLKRRRYETMVQMKGLEGKKPTFEWVDYENEIVELKKDLQKAEERLCSWKDGTMSKEDREGLLGESSEAYAPPEHILEMDVDQLKGQIAEFQKTPEELKKWEEYKKESGPDSDSQAKHEATPPNPEADEARWTQQGEVKYYEDYNEPKPKLKGLPEAALSRREVKKVSHTISKRAKDKPKAGVFIKLPKELAKQFPSLGEHDDSVPHITALFIGLVPEEHEILLEEIVKRVAMEHDPFELSLDNKVSYFPATKHSDDCKIAKLNIISPPLKALHKALKKAITNAEMAVDDHFPDYKPHTTLEYMEPPKEKYDSEFPKGSCTIDKIEIWNGDKKTTISLGRKKKSLGISVRAENDVSRLYGIPDDIKDELKNLPGVIFPVDHEFSPKDVLSGAFNDGTEGEARWSFFNMLNTHLGKRKVGYATVVNLLHDDGFNNTTVLRFESKDPYEVLEKLKEFATDPDMPQKMEAIMREKEKKEEDAIAEVIPLFGKEHEKKRMTGIETRLSALPGKIILNNPEVEYGGELEVDVIPGAKVYWEVGMAHDVGLNEYPITAMVELTKGDTSMANLLDRNGFSSFEEAVSNIEYALSTRLPEYVNSLSGSSNVSANDVQKTSSREFSLSSRSGQIYSS